MTLVRVSSYSRKGHCVTEHSRRLPQIRLKKRWLKKIERGYEIYHNLSMGYEFINSSKEERYKMFIKN